MSLDKKPALPDVLDAIEEKGTSNQVRELREGY